MGTDARAWYQRHLSFVVLLALATTLLLVDGAEGQDGGVEQDGNRVTVTVAIADSPPQLGPAGPGATGDWPYTCKWFDTPTPDAVAGAALRPIAGRLYVLICDPRPGSGRGPINQFEFYNPADPVPGEPGAVTSLTLADFARASLQPLPLGVGLSPDGEQITGVETWFWPVGSTDPIRVSATAGGLTVTVEARFQGTTFDVGENDVAPFTCTSFLEWAPGRTNSPCAHTYRTEEQGRTIEAASEWQFVWYDNAGQPTPVFFGTATIVEAAVVDVIDLEAVISRRG